MLRSRFLWQLYGAFGIVILVSTLVLVFFASVQVQQDTRSYILEDLKSKAILLRHIYRPALDQGDIVDLMALDGGEDTRVTLIAEDGRVLGDNRESADIMDNHGSRPEIIQARRLGVGDSTRFSDTVGFNMLYVAVRVDTNDRTLGYVRVAVPLNTIQRQLSGLRNQIYLSAAVITGFSLLVGFVLVRAFTRPIVEMTAAASRIAKGEFHLRVPGFRVDEIGQLGAAVNELAEGAEGRIAALTSSRDEISSVLVGLNEGVIAVNRLQHIIHINQAARVMLDLAQGDMNNRAIWELIRINEVSSAVENCMRDMTSVYATVKTDTRTLEVSVRPMLNEQSGVLTGAIIVLEDATEMLRLQRIRTDFVANASHELKTPISAIRGYAETIIDDDTMEVETRQRFTDRIRSQAARLDAIVQDLIQLSRFDAEQRTRADAQIDLGSLLRQVFRTKQQDAVDAGVELEIQLPEQQVAIFGERGALDQMVSNLLDNAIKYSRREGGHAVLRLSQQGGLALIEVQDNGIGIPQDEQQRIFERFYRVDRARSREKGGTGLGLSIVRRVAQSHNGGISVTSEPGQGATFTVRLPMAQPTD